MSILCRFDFHSVRWFKQSDDSWRPQCSRCRGTALWWLIEELEWYR